METTGQTPGEKSFDSLSSAAVRRFESDFRGDVIRPSDPAYDDARAIWNGMIDAYPALVARCSGAADVVAAVRFAAENGLEFRRPKVDTVLSRLRRCPV